MPLDHLIIEEIRKREQERRRREQERQPQLPIPEPPPRPPAERNPDDGTGGGVTYIDPDDNPYDVPL